MLSGKWRRNEKHHEQKAARIIKLEFLINYKVMRKVLFLKKELVNHWGIQIFRSLRNHDFRWFIGSALIGSVGDWILLTAQGWLVLQLTDSAFWVGMIAFILGIPALFLSPLGGSYADRFNRRKLLLIQLAASVFLIFLLATLVSTDVIAIWHIAVIFALIGSLLAFTEPSYMAIIPNLVKPNDLMNAIAMENLSWFLSRFIGPAIAGILLGLVAMGGTFYGAGAAFMVAFVLLLPMRSPATVKTKHASIVENMKEGLRYIWNNKTALMLMLMVASVSLFATPYFRLMSVFARDVLGVGEVGYGQLMMAVGGGGLAGAIIVMKMGNFKRKGWLLIGCALTFIVSLILFALSRVLHFSLVLAFISGITSGIYMAVATMLLLSVVTDQFRGRVMGLFSMTWQLPAVGSLMLGAVTDWIGLTVAIIAFALICTIIILGVFLRLPSLLEL